MNASTFLPCFVAALIATTASACTSKECTLELRMHRIELTRDVSTPASASDLRVEACAGTACKEATPDASGAFTFDDTLGATGPLEGTMTSAGAGSQRLSVAFSISEGQPSTTTSFRVRVLDAAGDPVTEETGEVRWSDDECHPTPDRTTL